MQKMTKSVWHGSSKKSEARHATRVWRTPLGLERVMAVEVSHNKEIFGGSLDGEKELILLYSKKSE